MKKTVLFIFIILFFLLYFFGSSYIDSNYKILSYEDYLAEKVLKANTGYHSGTVLFFFESGKKIEISPRYRKDEPLQNVHLLEEFIQTGDSIFKRKHSDTVFIFRKDTEYIFFIDK